MLRQIVTLTVFFLGLSVAATAATIHVPGDQPTIQAGIDAAMDSDTVLVADGIYTGDGNRDIELKGKSITVRSDHGPDSCIIDVQGSESDLHRAFIIQDDESVDTVIEGFTIRNGYLLSSQGSAIACFESSPTIRGNELIDNHCEGFGGAIYCHRSSALIRGNRFEGNEATYYGGGITLSNSDAVVHGNTLTGNGYFAILCLNSSGSEAEPVISNNVITGNTGGIYCKDCSPLIEGNSITGNESEDSAGGIQALGACAPTICDNDISGNRGTNGGGISLPYGNVIGNRITDNVATGMGGGIHIWGHSALFDILVRDNLISGNQALGVGLFDGGGGIVVLYGDSRLENNLIIGNRASGDGGGVRVLGDNVLFLGNTIVWNASGGQGGAIQIFSGDSVMRNSILYFNTPDQVSLSEDASLTITYSSVQNGYPGTGIISDDPLFVEGPGGQYFLSQLGAGQDVQSPCVDAGDPSSGPVQGTTRTDGLPDIGVVDMGFHYGSGVRLVTGPGAAPANPPEVRLFPLFAGAAPDESFPAYGATGFGVNVTVADLAGNDRDVILTGAGPGEVYGPHVRGFQPDGTPLPGLSFLAYGTNRFGVNVAGGDLEGDGMDEVVTGAGPGAEFGPHVRAWCYDGSSVAPMPGVSFLAYGTPKWGVNVSCGDIDSDGYDEIVTGAGPGAVYGPHVRGWNVDGGTAAAIPGVNFFAYGTLKFGVNVTCGDVDGDGIEEIVTGAGPGAVFAPHVRGWDYDGSSITPLPGLSFFAWNDVRFGATVFAGADLNGDGWNEIVVGCGPDPEAGTEVKVFEYDGTGVTLWFSLEAFEGLAYGTNVAAGSFYAEAF